VATKIIITYLLYPLGRLGFHRFLMYGSSPRRDFGASGFLFYFLASFALQSKKHFHFSCLPLEYLNAETC